MMAITNAIEITAPVFWTIVRAPAAMPRRWAAPYPSWPPCSGELNMPEPMPTRNSQIVLSQ